MTDIFISYSRKDGDFVRYLHGKLSEDKRDVWVDWEDIPATADWWAEIKAAIEAADAFAFVISPNSVRSDVCRQEIQHAIDNNKRFIPLLHQVVGDEDSPKMHPAIRSHNWIPFSDETQYEVSLKKLVDALSTDPDFLRRHTRLLVRAKEWEQNGRDASYLLKGAELNEFQNWLAESQIREPKPSELQLEYILASQNALTRSQLRLGFGVIAAVLVFVVLVAYLLIQNAQLEQTNALSTVEAQEIASTSQAQETQIAAQLTSIANIRSDSQNVIVQANLQNTQNALITENANLRITITALSVAVVSSPTLETGILSTATNDGGAGVEADEPSATPSHFSPTPNSISATEMAVEESSATATATHEAQAQNVPTLVGVPTREDGPEHVPNPDEDELADFYVNPFGNDNGDCQSRDEACGTIQGAINQAFEEAIIEIAPGVYNETLLIEKSVFLVGAGQENTIINGNFNATVVIVGEDGYVELYDLTITGGTTNFGAGILNYGELYLENVGIAGNFADLTGGAIANFGYLEAYDLLLLENYAPAIAEIYTGPYGESYVEGRELRPVAEPNELAVNLLVQINTTEGDSLNMRGQPGLNNRSLITPLRDGTVAVILGGPETHDGLRWWRIMAETGETGWVVESADGVETLLPLV